MRWGELELRICIRSKGKSIWALGNRFSDHIKVIYTDITLGKQGPLISQSDHEYIVYSEDVRKLNSIGEMGSDPVIQPSTIYGSCGITMNHFLDDLSRVSEYYKPRYS